jgi:PBP1b-binding outer membrane lipoprotein LpoB
MSSSSSNSKPQSQKIDPPPYALKASKDRMRQIIKEVQDEYLGASTLNLSGNTAANTATGASGGAQANSTVVEREALKYSSDEANKLTTKISDEVKNRLRDLGLPRYKFVVQVVLGENRTEGVHVGHRCLWDNDTDNYASVSWGNDSLFCVTTVYGVYQY